MHGRSQAITSCRSAEKGQSLLGWRNALKDWAVLLPTFKIFRWSPEIFRVQCLHVGKGKMNPHIFSSPAQLFVLWFNLGRLLQHHPHFGGYRGSGWEKCNNFFSKSDFLPVISTSLWLGSQGIHRGVCHLSGSFSTLECAVQLFALSSITGKASIS